MDNDPAALIAVPHEHADAGARYVALAGGVLLLTLPVAAWWLVGDLSYRGTDDLDYFFRAPAVPAAVERIAGLGALVAALAAVLALAVAAGRRRVHPRWWLALLPLIGAGVLTGLAGRVMTSGGIGVNFGAIFALVLGVPAVVSLLLTGVLVTVVLRGRARRRRSGLPAGPVGPAAAVYGANLAAVPALAFAFSAVSAYAVPVLAVALLALILWSRRRNAGPPPTERRQAVTAAGYGALAGALLILVTIGVGVVALPVVTLVTTLVVGTRARRAERLEPAPHLS